jgi:hypothetical protein
MIKLEKYETLGWEHAIRGMRNPMNSWDRSDSYYCLGPACPDDAMLNLCKDNCRFYKTEDCENMNFAPFIIGPNDHELMMKLRNAGTDHRKYMRMIAVYVDITAPLYWWKEFDTYKVGTVANSCSTMHKIHEKEFTLDDFSYEHLTDGSINLLNDIICELNRHRSFYNRYDEFDNKNFTNGPITCKKDLWWQMIQLLPTSYNQKRTVMLNYEVLANIYKSRKNHKLDEWREFCQWIEQLPYSEIITGIKETEDKE